MSFAITFILDKGESLSISETSEIAIGESFTELTVTVNLPVSSVSVPSETVYV